MAKQIHSVSVIIPTYNRENFIVEAISSVTKQTFSATEIIVIDDGSVDRTSMLISKYFPLAHYIRTSNRGVSSARNIGIQHSTGNLVAFLDSDDLWLPEKLEEQISYLSENPNYRILHCDEEWWRRGEILPQKSYHKKKGGDIFSESLARCVVSPSAVMIRRNIFQQFGLFDPSFKACEDYDLWLRISSLEPIGFVDKKLVIKRGGHNDQLSKCIKALDRYRIQSIKNIIETARLTPLKKKAAKKELINKIEIYKKGAFKRGKSQEIKRLDRLLCQILSS